MVHGESGDARASPPEALRLAEAALRRLGYARIPPVSGDTPLPPEFWVQEAGVPRRTFPVYVEGATEAAVGRASAWAKAAGAGTPAARAIFVVPTERAADEAWATVQRSGGGAELAILVVDPHRRGGEEPKWHAGALPPRELLWLATGVVVGLFRRAQSDEGGAQIDFSEMLQLLRTRFGVDVKRSLGVESDEDALFLLYHLAQRDSYAPGDSGANLHTLVLKPTGPAARLPWFAA